MVNEDQAKGGRAVRRGLGSSTGHLVFGYRRPGFTRFLVVALVVVVGLVSGILIIGAIAGAFSSHKIQGTVQAKIVNDTGSQVHLAFCIDSGCLSTDDGQTLQPGEAFDQALGPNDRERFAIDAPPGFGSKSSQVPGKGYRCTQLLTTDIVEKTYGLSSLTACR